MIRLVVKNVTSRQHSRGLAWGGVLFADNIPVVDFHNAGVGGCTSINWRPNLAPQFKAEVEVALLAKAEPDAYEPLDDALGWLWDVAVCGGDEAEARRLRAKAVAEMMADIGAA